MIKYTIEEVTDKILLSVIKQYGNVEIDKYYNEKKTLIKNFPYKNIELEIKPENTGLFVIRVINFYFFNYKLLERYLEVNLKHNHCTYRLTNKCIYIYPINNVSDMLFYAVTVINNTIREIENVLK